MALADEARAIAGEAREMVGLLGDAMEQLGKLVQNEVELAKSEMSQKAAQAGKGIALLVGGGILAIPVLVVLLISLALWLQTFGFSPALAHLIAAGIGAVCTTILAFIGKKQLEADKLTPKVTIDEVSKDMQAAKELGR